MKFFSPTPRTFISSSIFLNGPFFWRYSTIRAAVFAPMPGSPSRSAGDAVFRLTMAVDGAVVLAAERGAGLACASAGGDGTADSRHDTTNVDNRERNIKSSL